MSWGLCSFEMLRLFKLWWISSSAAQPQSRKFRMKFSRAVAEGFRNRAWRPIVTSSLHEHHQKVSSSTLIVHVQHIDQRKLPDCDSSHVFTQIITCHHNDSLNTTVHLLKKKNDVIDLYFHSRHRFPP
jgi:hypothetical protein